MTLRILAVHGIWNHRPHLTRTEAEQDITTTWRAALPASLHTTAGDIDLAAAYYAPDLNVPTPQALDDGLDHLPDDAHHWLLAWAEQLDALPADTPQAAWSIPARAIADRIADNAHLNKLLVRPVVNTFLTEVRAYFHPHSTARQTAQRVVANAIRNHQPDIILAHSLGSVVTYEALHIHTDLHTDLLVTLGSPLALAHVIFDRLQPPPRNGHGASPPGVATWINIADPGDIIAIPRPFTRRFTPDHNWDDTHIHWLDFHTAARYLASPRTTKAITDYLGNRRN